ncbi:MAG: thermonuclease family protein [Candidatus Puniceispirillaceae bacterium]|jgi:endonuclease YncB( thermonuclease family)
MKKLCLIIAAVFILQAAIQPGAATDRPFSLAGEVSVTKVSDGDSLRSGRLKIRLHGIDAPELKQNCTTSAGTSWPCGRAARDAMASIAMTAPLRCDLMDVDRYGRLIMRCFAGKTDIARHLVTSGLALAYTRYSADYAADEAAARADGRGIWDGDFEAPWDWRRQN